MKTMGLSGHFSALSRACAQWTGSVATARAPNYAECVLPATMRYRADQHSTDRATQSTIYRPFSRRGSETRCGNAPDANRQARGRASAEGR